MALSFPPAGGGNKARFMTKRSKELYEAEKRFQKCLAQWAGASTPGEAAAAEGRVRALMEKHDIDPWDVSDTSYYIVSKRRDLP